MPRRPLALLFCAKDDKIPSLLVTNSITANIAHADYCNVIHKVGPCMDMHKLCIATPPPSCSLAPPCRLQANAAVTTTAPAEQT